MTRPWLTTGGLLERGFFRSSVSIGITMSFAIFAKAVSTVDGFLCAVHADSRARAKKPTFVAIFKFRIDLTLVLLLGFGDPRWVLSRILFRWPSPFCTAAAQ